MWFLHSVIICYKVPTFSFYLRCSKSKNCLVIILSFDITIYSCLLFLYSCLETQLPCRMVLLQFPLLWVLPEDGKLVSG